MSRSTRLALVLLAWCTSAARARAQDSIFVTSRFSDEVLRYDAGGAFLGVFASGGGLDNPVGLTFGPDGDLYVASGDTDQVLRYDGTSGAFVSVFASGGGLVGTRQVNFGPDGHLYVASGATNRVLRYDGASGAFLGIAATGGGLSGPTSFTFGSDGLLYVGSVLNDRIKRFDPASGLFLDNFVTTGLDGPHDLAFGPDGKLYVTNAFSTRIQRYDGTSGAFLDTFVLDARLLNPLGLSWNEQGDLVVVNQGHDEVLRYDGVTGAFLGASVASGLGGLASPLFAAFEPRAGLRFHAPVPGVAGTLNFATLSGATPGGALRFGFDVAPRLRVARGCPALLRLIEALTPRTLVADESGRAFVRAHVALGMAGQRYLLRAVEARTCASTALLLAPF